jgi:GNAT superfamily N-acetyltransferase
MERMSLACTLGILDWQSRTISTPAPMADPLERYTLRPPRSPADWGAYHAIRRDAIFAPLLPGQAYDEHDPDEFKPGHIPHLLVRDGEIVGTVRIDLIDDAQAGLRLIGIRNDLQRQGHGAVLLQLAEKAAQAFGRSWSSTRTRHRSPSIWPTAIASATGRMPGRCRRRSFGSGSDCVDQRGGTFAPACAG